MRALTVTEFLQGINDVLAGVPALVEGEVSQWSIRQERWAFFSLKDEQAVVECFMPAWKLRHEIEDGMRVRVAGVPRVYEKNGRFRITVEALEPSGEGSLKRAFELLKQKLEREGLFAQERKRTLPRFPETIGIIASMDSAAYSDFLRILQNRWSGVRLLVRDVAVQGESAIGDIVSAFRAFDPQSTDLLVLTRGGGSLEDLHAFNSEEVARAIFASSVPVVVGVGHERDVTIADLVADVRASTPSNAAERVVPDRRDIGNEVRAMAEHVAVRCTMAARERRGAIDRFLLRGGSFAHARRVGIDTRAAAMTTRMHALRQAFAARLTTADRLMANLNPTRLLARGYSMTTVRGAVVRDAAALRVGDRLTTRFARGSATSVVESTSGA